MIHFIKIKIPMKNCIILFISLFIFNTGCDYANESESNENEKVFDVRLEI